MNLLSNVHIAEIIICIDSKIYLLNLLVFVVFVLNSEISKMSRLPQNSTKKTGQEIIEFLKCSDQDCFAILCFHQELDSYSHCDHIREIHFGTALAFFLSNSMACSFWTTLVFPWALWKTKKVSFRTLTVFVLSAQPRAAKTWNLIQGHEVESWHVQLWPAFARYHLC